MYVLENVLALALPPFLGVHYALLFEVQDDDGLTILKSMARRSLLSQVRVPVVHGHGTARSERSMEPLAAPRAKAGHGRFPFIRRANSLTGAALGSARRSGRHDAWVDCARAREPPEEDAGAST